MAAVDVQQYESLPRFEPSSAASAQNGKYVIKCTEEEFLETTSSQYQQKQWFQTPPLDATVVSRIHSIQLLAESHDQGYCSDPAAGDWTWFELSILRNEEAINPRQRDEIELTWESHNNRLCTDDWGWEAGKLFEENHDMLRGLEAGNVVSVRLRSRFAGWAIYARTGYLVIELGDAVQREPLRYGRAKSNVEGMAEVMQDINKTVMFSSLKISGLSSQLFRAEMINTAESDRPLRVLALDGGGVRGIAALMLLKEVMEKGAPGKKPCEVFDMIGGTSTGGFIAIMLGRMKMSVDETIDQYQKFMGKVFKKTWTNGTWDPITGAKWSKNPLEEVIKTLVKDKLGGNPDEVKLMDEKSQNDPCKVFVMAVNQLGANNHAPVLFRTYRNPLDMSELPDIKLWEAARATSAAPTYFPPMTVGDYTFVDGGLQANNPLGWLWNEVLANYGPARPTTCFLSIGTGVAASESLSGIKNLASNMSGVATNTEVINVLFRSLINAFAPKAMGKKYWRFNVGDGLPEWVELSPGQFGWKLGAERVEDKDLGKLDDIAAIPRTVEKVKDYLRLPAAVNMVKECAETLAV